MTGPRIVEIHKAVQDRNGQIAARNRALFREHGLFVINVMSAPGSGKTEFLARTLADDSVWCGPEHHPVPAIDGSTYEPWSETRPSATIGPPKLRMAVIVGDIATDNDAQRLSRTGAQVVQITTGGYCHLDAGMIERALDGMDLNDLDVLIIENVGNMVCPATFDLGESARIAILSVTEGEDKPLKYPTLFKRAEVVVVNKMDIAEAVGYDRDVALDNLRRIAPQARIFEVSARKGRGMDPWYEYLATGARLAHDMAPVPCP